MARVRSEKHKRPTDICFEAVWLNGPYARSIGREQFWCHDLTEAVNHAARRFQKAEPMATGFNVSKADGPNNPDYDQL